MENEDIPSLPEQYDAAYIFPFTKYSWKSDRARWLWIDLETWQNALAGPISCIVNKGNCAYVYGREDEYFAGIDNPTALRARLLEWHGKLTEGLAGFIPAMDDEEADFEAMRRFASEMWAVAEKAMESELHRWTRERDGNQVAPRSP